MKKSLVALAVLAAAGAASAQSSVTLYGRLDLGGNYVKQSANQNASIGALGLGGYVRANAASKDYSVFGNQHARTTSRIGFIGREDLGGGVAAIFNYEFKIDPDNTASNSVLGTRNFYAGLTGGFGTVALGTGLNPFDDLRGYSASTYSIGGGDFLTKHAVGFKFIGIDGKQFGAGPTDVFGKPADTVINPGAAVIGGSGIGARSINSIGY
ncbi:MAG: porin, partial [Variovorax sp.]